MKRVGYLRSFSYIYPVNKLIIKIKVMLELLKEAKNEFVKNPKECIQDSVMLLLIFATGYYMLILGSILGLQ